MSYTINKRLKFSHCAIVFLLVISSCKKYIEVDNPSTSIDVNSAFSSNTGAAQVLTGLYADMSKTRSNGSAVSSCILPELSADNLTLFDPLGSQQFIDYYRNSLEPRYLTSGGEFQTFWASSYKMIYTVNNAIEQLTDNARLNKSIANQLLGEAYFMRAFLYFYLVNYYGKVPLVLATDYRANATVKNTEINVIYTQVLADLQKAEELLDFNYYNGDASRVVPERLRPNRVTAYALKARAYLYLKDYPAAETFATKVITQSGFNLTNPETAFLKNSSETIWALQPVEIGFNTALAPFFLLPETGPNAFEFPVYASESLVESFEKGDLRYDKWLGVVHTNGQSFYFPAKYNRGFIREAKDISEYTIVFRVAEQYLIRAEARNEQNKTLDAIADLNAIRDRSRAPASADIPDPLPTLSDNLTQTQIRSLVLNERRIELFTEWGHRWFDLRRSGTIDDVMTIAENIKGGNWESYKQYYPIPQYDITTNPQIKQTPGYEN